MGLPVILVGGVIAQKYGFGSALLAVVLGNLVLWAVGLAIIGMTVQKRTNAIENTEIYLSRTGAVIASVVLGVAFLIWYTLQLQFATTSLAQVMPAVFAKAEALELRLGAVLGIFIALLSLLGMRGIKQIAVFSLPFLFFYVIYVLIFSRPEIVQEKEMRISLSAIVMAMTVTFPGIINLPTFFRHARSKAHAVLGLTVMTAFVIFFQCFTVWAGLSDPAQIFNFVFKQDGGIHLILTVLFILVSLTCINLVNIYFASAAWEMIFKRGAGAKEYAIVGLGGTAVFTFMQLSKPMYFIENMANNFIGSLGAVLLIAFIVKMVVKHRPRPMEKWVSMGCWMIGCAVASIAQVAHPEDISHSFLVGIGASFLAFILVLFIEETIWSVQTLMRRKNRRH